MPDLVLDSVAKKFGDVIAVKDVNYKIEDGEFAALLGPSGCGKTTTLLMIAGIYRPTAGKIIFGDRVVNNVHPKNRDIGMVFQSYALYPNMTVFDNIAFPLKLKKTPKDEIEKKIKKITSLLEIANLLDRKPGQLSGGQQQRVALARALVKEPKYLLLDEPLSNLDAKLRVNMRTEIKRLHRELGITTILVTHDQEEAMSLADKIILMNKGVVQQIGDHSDLYYKPQNLFVAGFIGSPAMNFIDFKFTNHNGNIKLSKNGVELEFKDLKLKKEPSGEIVTLGIRPEHLRESNKDKNIIDGKVFSIEPLGREILVAANTKIGIIHFLVPSPFKCKIDDGIRLGIDPQDIHLFDTNTGEALLDK
ncbi:carbohydrate ABC transporter ATP-binding protein (CUT1 family) [Halanaerobium saccharolyticum]|uniref:Carbohydrate ABC transporter ATP-binding protein (CUT1 family) n=1 Tax=Halanaerobium saccharolyticum TaxID=43595 RepID=A0A2T5RF39_9FIRM|nr:ABC transporter ATP-binding protein [Halanaerobium saccharolyticum]PTV92725.1 carbohydrate ABC transporter ATP-binding protein (CUT1 family) [Halanaerobium saccharolyticum]